MSDLTERLRHAHVHSAQRIMGSNIFEEAADEIGRLHAALTLALPVLEVAAQRFSGAKEALEAVKAAMEGKT